MVFGWHSVLLLCVSLALCISIWLCICAKCKRLIHCDVWIWDDYTALWMRSAESNLLRFLYTPFFSRAIQTRQMTEYPSLSLFLSPPVISLFYPFISDRTPFAQDYLSHKFGVMDHVVLEWHRDSTLEVWNSWHVDTLTLLQIFFINVSYRFYLHERVCESMFISYVGHRIMLVTKTLGSKSWIER